MAVRRSISLMHHEWIKVTFRPTKHQPPSTVEPRRYRGKRKQTEKRNHSAPPQNKEETQVAAQLGSRTTGARHLSATAPAAARKATASLGLRGRAKTVVAAWGRGTRCEEEKLGNLRSRARRTNVPPPPPPPALWPLGSGRARQRKLRYRPGEESKRAPGVFAVIRRRLAFVARLSASSQD
ncbi:hypothetical protein PAHAL_3G206400 [Panicum hallii]|uniref:Uncharacterized protein n=1 Tax=Panicum hallii TaxID=206008 RepID=A0A2T8KIU8_9POAL|nr:hypothetical protein PAHAL_3G206400 [Panicum hallii]